MPLLSGVPDPKVGAASRIISRMGGDSFHLAVAENGVARGVASLTVALVSPDLESMSREQKLKAMHEIWEDLAGEDQSLESPSWHAQALQETIDRVRDGRESIHDWEEAKEELRRRM